MTSATAQEPIRLSFADGTRQVLVLPEDQDRFFLTCSQAAEACRQAYNREAWKTEFHGMLFSVKDWIQPHANRIRACYVSVRDGQLVVFITPILGRYDRELDVQLTELDILIAAKFPLLRVEMMLVPGDTPERLAAFLDTTRALQIHGHDSRAQAEVAAQP